MPKTAIYELAVLYHSDFEADLDKVGDKVKQLVTDHGGKILEEHVWGKRQLAYPIKKQTHALYVFYDLEIAGTDLIKIETSLNITEEVLRYQFHKPDLKAKAAAEAALEKKKSRLAKVGAKKDES